MDAKLNKILIIDDEYLTLHALSLSLKKVSSCVVKTENGEEAIEYLKHHDDVELIITDFYMPKKDGGHVISHVLENRYSVKGRHIPIILVSGYKDVIDSLKNNDLLLRVIEKPYSHGSLIKAIREEINDMVVKGEIQLLRTSIAKLNEVFESLRCVLDKVKEDQVTKESIPA